MRIIFLLPSMLIASAVALPSILPRTNDPAADNVLFSNDSAEVLDDFQIADNTIYDASDTDAQSPAITFEIADASTRPLTPTLPCLNQNHEHVVFWRSCGYYNEGSYLCKRLNCTPGYLLTGKDGHPKMCTNDGDCTQNWFKGAEPPK